MTPSPATSPTAPPVRLLICGFGGFPGFPDNPAARVVERLRATAWAPPRAETAYQLIPTTWGEGHRAAARAAKAFEPDGVLVLGVAGGADCFRVETQACNLAGTGRPDAEGAVHDTAFISLAGPDIATTTAPAAAMVEAIAKAGLPVCASSNAGDYLCNYVFYRLLTEAPASCTAFLHLPPDLDLDALERGAKAAAAALGLSLRRTTRS